MCKLSTSYLPTSSSFATLQPKNGRMSYLKDRFGKFATTLCIAVCLFAIPAIGAEPTIREIHVLQQGDTRLDETFILSHIASRVGKPVDNRTVSADVRTLLESNRFAYVGTRVEPLEDGVRLVFIVERRLRIAGKIEFEGMRALRQSRVMDVIGITSGDFADTQIVGTAAERLRKKYIEKRYYDVKIEPQLKTIPENPGAARLTFSIEEGPRSKVKLIKINGNKAISDRRLRRASGQSPWWNPAGWFTDERVSDFELEVVKSDMRRQYLDAGFLDVSIDGPKKIRTGNTYHITADINEGPVYKVGEVSLEGVTLFPESMILNALPLKPGQTAGLTAIDAARTAVREFFVARGYVDTRVQMSTYPDETRAETVNLVLSVKEGVLTNVRNILIRGNTSTKDKVIRREILLNPGEIYDGVLAERSQRRLKNLGYFSDVRNYDITVDEDTRDLVYELEEKSTGSLMFGAGFSSIDNLIGMFEISQSNFDISNLRNFRGAGQKARLTLQVSADATDLEASFIEPWFLDRRLAFETLGFLRNRSFNEYDERRGGATVGLAKHVPWVGRIGLAYTLQHIRLSDVIDDPFHLADAPETAFRFTDEDDAYLLGSLRLSWTYDTRDNPMIPQSGTRATAYLTVYNSVLASDYDLYEIDWRWRNYQPLWYGHVISFSARASTIDAYGNDTVPISSRYFLGGGRNARGFKYRNIGPKALYDEGDGTSFRPVGGQSLLDASIEYTIPILKVLRFGIFYDIGNVWTDAYDFDLSEYASSVGAGLRLDIPGFPIRLDYAHALDKDDDLTRKRAFVFWVGFDN